MSMKYYAVTDDPNELLHYGVKGMKWGQHLFGDDLKPKSAGYKRALGKLRASVKRSSTQRSINRQRKQQDKYNKAVQKAQSNFVQLERMSNYNRGVKASKRRVKYNKAVKQEKNRADMINNLLSVDRDRKYYDQINRDLKRERKAAKSMKKIERYQKDAEVGSLATQARQAKRAAKVDKKFDRVLQKARKGTLKYGNLSEEQVARIQNRLNSEANARKLGSAEKTWHQQKKEARRRGKLSGIEKGTAAIMEEVARAGAQVGIQHLLDRHKMNAAAKQEGKRDRIKAREKNRKTVRDIKRDFKQEVREQEIREGIGIFDRSHNFKSAAASKEAIEAKRLEQKRNQSLLDKIKEDRAKRLMEYFDDHDTDLLTERKSYLESLGAEGAKNFNKLSWDERNKRIEDNILSKSRAEKEKKKQEEKAAKKQEEYEKSRTNFMMESLKQKLRQYNEDVKNHNKAIIDKEKAISNLRNNKTQMDEVKYNDRLTKLKTELEELKSHPPKEPKFEDFFKS